MDVSLKIVIVDENPIRAAILQDGLREAGHLNVTHIDDRTGLLARIYAIDPDVILIDLENPSRDELEQMFQMSRAVKRLIDVVAAMAGLVLLAPHTPNLRHVVQKYRIL